MNEKQAVSYIAIRLSIKLISLSMIATILILSICSKAHSRDEQILTYGTFMSFLIVTSGISINMIAGKSIDRLVEAYFLITLIVLLLASGVMAVLSWFAIKNGRRRTVQYQDENFTFFYKGLFSIFAAVLCSFDFSILLITDGNLNKP